MGWWLLQGGLIGLAVSALLPWCFRQKQGTATLISERTVYHRYLAVYDRKYSIQGASGKEEVSFDVIGHPSLENFTFVVVCPVLGFREHRQGSPELDRDGLNPRTSRTYAFVEEFAAGSGSRHLGFPSGGVDRGEEAAEAARRELLEEAGLTAGASCVRPLLPPGHPGILEVKWSRNRFLPFVALNPRLSRSAVPPEIEESGIRVVRLDETGAMEMLRAGSMFLPSAVTLQLALDWLRNSSEQDFNETRLCKCGPTD